jgi:hypothetical protein
MATGSTGSACCPLASASDLYVRNTPSIALLYNSNAPSLWITRTALLMLCVKPAIVTFLHEVVAQTLSSMKLRVRDTV